MERVCMANPRVLPRGGLRRGVGVLEEYGMGFTPLEGFATVWTRVLATRRRGDFQVSVDTIRAVGVSWP